MTFEPWQNGITEIDEEHLNQLIDAWANIFGVTGPNPARLAKLLLPYLATHPSSPIAGQMWMASTALSGVLGGMLYYRNDNAGNVAIMAPRGYVVSAPLASSSVITSTSFTDVGLAMPIVCSGGRLKIKLIPPETTNGLGSEEGCLTSASTGEFSVALVRAVINILGVDIPLAEQPITLVSAEATAISGISLSLPAGCFEWVTQQVSGTINVRIQGRVVSPTTLYFRTGLRLSIEEQGY